MFSFKQHFLSSFSINGFKNSDKRQPELLMHVVMEIDRKVVL
jgi:hypothetical protein